MSTNDAGREHLHAVALYLGKAHASLEAAQEAQAKAREDAAREKLAAAKRTLAERAQLPTVSVSRRWLRELASAIHESRNDPRGLTEIACQVDAAAGKELEPTT
jgi:hypothetical protein